MGRIDGEAEGNRLRRVVAEKDREQAGRKLKRRKGFMASVKYALERGGAKRLELIWTGNWDDVKVRLDGQEIGSFQNIEHFRGGQDFQLEDGSVLTVRLGGGKIVKLPEILRNGEPVPTNPYNPAKRLSMSWQCLSLIGGLYLFVGIISLFNSSVLASLPVRTWPTIGIGLLFLLLAVLVLHQFKIALRIAVVLLVLNIIAPLVFHHAFPWPLLILATVLRLAILFVVLQGFGAINELRREQAKGELTAGVEG